MAVQDNLARELRSACDQLREAYGPLLAAFDSLPEPALITYAGHVVWANHNACTRLIDDGQPDRLLTGSPMGELFPGYAETDAGEGVDPEPITACMPDGTMLQLSWAPFDVDARRMRLVMAHDVTERDAYRQKFESTDRTLQESQRIGRIGSWELDLVDDALRWSPEIFRLFEIDPERFEASYDAFLNAIHPDDRDAVNAAYTGSLQTRTPYEITHRLKMTDGRIKHVLERCESFYAPDGTPLRSVGTVQDVTDSVVAGKRLENELSDKKILLQEIHHRVKNNLQMVSSLLFLQGRASKDSAIAAAFHDSCERIRAFALVHENLYASDVPSRIDMQQYAVTLANNLIQAFDTGDHHVRLELRGEPFELELDRAIPVGLIINELLTNAMKHAFPDDRHGCITITTSALGQSYEVSIADDGIGHTKKPSRAGALGYQLLPILADQTGATLEDLPGHGTAVRVQIPKQAT